MSLMQYQLRYHTDSARLFSGIAHLPWAMFLDSGQLINPATGNPASQYGRYDILVANPFMTFSNLGQDTTINAYGKTYISTEDPIELIKEAMLPYQASKADWPFTGGAVGYWGYDLARRFERLESIAQDAAVIPQMQIGLYDWAVVVDHRNQTAHLLSNGFDLHTHEIWDSLCRLFDVRDDEVEELPSTTFKVTSAISSNITKQDYAEAFKAIQTYIHDGDCYQVNLAQRFSAKATGDAWQAYQKLREISPAPFMAYMNFNDMFVMSGSPERFLQLVNGHVETRPIKGTRPRADDLATDKRYAEELLSSLKDRAENLMIVDLLRNDIGKNCVIGSVKADKLFQLQSFANVHHLVSIITGELQANKTALDLLRGCFPGGSITGAPKLRSMQIIESLEPHRRGIYCGAIGYIGFDGNMDTNIAIRTAVYIRGENHADGEISFYAGGGVVADSDLEKEYMETWDKASSMLKLVGIFTDY
jgi:para-aminobenzoate synthetase component 1